MNNEKKLKYVDLNLINRSMREMFHTIVAVEVNISIYYYSAD